MFSLKRFSLILPALVFVALFLGPKTVRADNVVITGGGLSKSQTAVVNYGFSGVGLSFIGHGSTNVVFCSSCLGGSIVHASMPFVLENSGGATVAGIHYPRVFYTGTIVFTSGPMAIPVDDPTLPLQLNAAFTMSGNVNMYLNDPALGDPGPAVFSSTLSGQGIVTLDLQSAVINGERHYNQVGVIYTFQPNEVPEPATLLLLGSGLTGLVMKARRTRKGDSAQDNAERVG
jgi:hypothetical protein